MNDKDLQKSIRDFAKKQGNNKYLKMKNTINTLL